MSEKYSRDERKAQVWQALKERGGAGLTRAGIARALGLKKSPHLIGIINECVASGEVIAGITDDPGFLPTMYYDINWGE